MAVHLARGARASFNLIWQAHIKHRRAAGDPGDDVLLRNVETNRKRSVNVCATDCKVCRRAVSALLWDSGSPINQGAEDDGPLFTARSGGNPQASNDRPM